MHIEWFICFNSLFLCRYKEGGEALLVLLPSEEKGMIEQLQEKKVPINKIQWVQLIFPVWLRSENKRGLEMFIFVCALVCEMWPDSSLDSG